MTVNELFYRIKILVAMDEGDKDIVVLDIDGEYLGEVIRVSVADDPGGGERVVAFALGQ